MARFSVNTNLLRLAMAARNTLNDCFERDGSYHFSPFIVGQIGEELPRLAELPVEDGTEIDALREAAFAMFLGDGPGAVKFDRVLFVSEAWAVYADDNDFKGPTPGTLQDNPDRHEIVVFEGRDRSGNVLKADALVRRARPSEVEALTPRPPENSRYVPSTNHAED